MKDLDEERGKKMKIEGLKGSVEWDKEIEIEGKIENEIGKNVDKKDLRRGERIGWRSGMDINDKKIIRRIRRLSRNKNFIKDEERGYCRRNWWNENCRENERCKGRYVKEGDDSEWWR